MILLRGGRETLEVLLVRRTPEARFMGGVWVFPGGAVDGAEGDGEVAFSELGPRVTGVAEHRHHRATGLQFAEVEAM